MLYAFGSNVNGGLGDGTTTHQPIAVPVLGGVALS